MEFINKLIVFDDEEERRQWVRKNDVPLPPAMVGLLREECDEDFLKEGDD